MEDKMNTIMQQLKNWTLMMGEGKGWHPAASQSRNFSPRERLYIVLTTCQTSLKTAGMEDQYRLALNLNFTSGPRVESVTEPLFLFLISD